MRKRTIEKIVTWILILAIAYKLWYWLFNPGGTEIKAIGWVLKIALAYKLWHWCYDDTTETDVGKKGTGPLKNCTSVVKTDAGVQLWENGPYWAKCNVGASRSAELGYYFRWGDTIGYRVIRRSSAASSNSLPDDSTRWVSSDGRSYSESPFTSEAYKVGKSDGSSAPRFRFPDGWRLSAGYIDSTGNLVAAHDAATAHLGAPWRMPSRAEFGALIENCDVTYKDVGGVRGFVFCGRGIYSSKSIFFPVEKECVCIRGTSYDEFTSLYLSVTPSERYQSAVWSLCLSRHHNYDESDDYELMRTQKQSSGIENDIKDDSLLEEYPCYYGFCVRPVRDAQ